MVAQTRTSHNNFVHVLLLAVVCVSVIYISDGNKAGRKRRPSRNKPLPEVRRYCRAMSWLDRRQKKMCAHHPEMMSVVQDGVKNALSQCRRKFAKQRWNCSPLTWNQVFSEGGILKKRSRETAFVQALTSASVMIEIAKACTSGDLKSCHCGSLPANRRRDKNRKWVWDGCGHNINYGSHFTKNFMDPKKIKSHSRKAKSHNQIVGRRVVRRKMQRKCACHGKSDSCAYKTCWRVVPSIEDVADDIYELYSKAVRSRFDKKAGQLRVPRGDSSRLPRRLVYFTKSEDFCNQNLSLGVMGTVGRTCNHTSNGPDSCSTMCCGRPYKTAVTMAKVKCNCRFVWCCNVVCDTCDATRVVDSCS